MKQVGVRSVRPRMVSLALGVSVAAVAAGMVASPAAAQCAPDPTVANGTTTCTGADADGLRVTAPSTVEVTEDASVRGAGAAAITVDVPGSTGWGGMLISTLNVLGAVDGGAASGISVLSARSGFEDVLFNITVGQGASVTGANAVVVGRNPANSYYTNVSASIDNAGTITGTSGVALAVELSGYGGYQKITNRSTGVIGAISAPVGALSNAGLIDGGANSAIDARYGSGLITRGDWNNTGTITSASGAGTITRMGQGAPALVNFGSVRNTGGGTALSGDFVILDNRSGGTISAAGGTAINADLGLSLVNAGTITGDVFVRTPSYYGFGGRIDSTAGKIDGSVIFGASTDVLIARYDGTPTLRTGITGAIDGGDGVNSVQLLFDENATVDTGVILPTSFQRLRLMPSDGATVTLDPGFTPPGMVELIGSGAIVNRANISTTGSVFIAPIDSMRQSLDITNAAIVRTSGGVAFGLDSVNTFRNGGTIDVADGVGVDMSTSGGFVNTGTITATGTAVSVFSTDVDNQGTIRSTGGFGVAASGSSGDTLTNSGTIEGATYGALVRLHMNNSGEVTGGAAGIRLDAYGSVDNMAGGVVSGPRSIMSLGSAFMTVVNAGTLNGDVVLADPVYGGSNNTYVAAAGGVLNGNLVLGSFGRLVVDLANTGGDRFAGITGDVSTTQGTLVLRATSDASAVISGPAAPFSTLVHEAIGDATLTLTALSAVTRSVLVAGTGAVDIRADFAVASQPAVATTATAPITGEDPYPATTVGITSRGNINAMRAADGSSAFFSAVSLGYDSSFTNAGAITLDGADLAGVAGGAQLINTGRITGSGGTGPTAVIGVFNVGRTMNSGVIEVNGAGVVLGSGPVHGASGTLVNSGTITSTGGAAVRSVVHGATVDNLAGGVITGRSGVYMPGGAVANAGTINGTVQLASLTQYGWGSEPAAFASAGGVVNGGVLFGGGDDLFLQFGDTTGVTRTVDGGDGEDMFGRAYSASATVALGELGGVNFERQLIQARGPDTTVTITGETADGLSVGGDGRIVNQATIAGVLTAYLPYGGHHHGSALPDAFGAGLLSTEIRNEGTLRGGFAGYAKSFVNAGAIGAQEEDGRGAFVGGVGDLSFANSGAIATEPFENAVELGVEQARAVTIDNSGQVTGGFSAYADFNREDGAGTLSFRNTGAIASVDEETSGVYLSVTGKSGAAVTLDNSGVLSAAGADSRALTLGFHATYAYPGAPAEPSGAVTYAITNSGFIEANGGGLLYRYAYADGPRVYTSPASALAITADREATGAVVNTATGRISATGERSTAVGVIGTALDLTNAGVISGTAGTELDPADGLARAAGQTFLAGAIHAYGAFGDTVRNTGTITGSIDLGLGDDRIENRGVIDGAVFLRAGDDRYLQGAGGTLTGVVDGGDGADVIEVDATGGGAVAAERFANFERLTQSGAGVVSYSGAFGAPTVELNGGGLRVEAGRAFATAGTVAVTGSNLAESVEAAGAIAGDVALGAGDDTFAELGTGRVSGLVDGGAGSDLYRVSLAGDRTGLSPVLGFERLAVDGSGVLSLASTHAFDAVALSSGRVIGLAGSTIRASTIDVGQGATFGSAGTVDGNVAVAGTLSPGASPGTMTVNGNVALAGTSTTLFEITPVASDRLVVNGALSIASGATLRIEATGQLQPGASLDLIAASGGITGSFTNVVKPDSLFGFLVQQGGRLSLLGQFRNDASFSGQVGGTIDYANSVLVGGRADAALLAAAPGLVGANGASNAQAFALLAPEAYASARQAAVEQGLTLADAGRGAGFANRRAEPGVFTFGQFAADQRTLRADAERGTARAKFGGYGLFGGLGYAGENWSLGGFAGYLDGRQRLDGRGATTELTGAAFGVHGRAEMGAFGVTATAAYAATEADTRRALPGGSARGTYDLANLTLDVAAAYEVAIGGDWALKPRIGGTVVRVERDAVAETGSAAFAAQVAEDGDTAAFFDGALTAAKTGTVRPFATLGLRYQAAGRDSLALTGFGGGGLDLVVEGAQRARVLGTAAVGVEADLRPGVTLFSAVAAERGEDDQRESARIGLRVGF